ncbi:MAG: RluA family pseudouridine synthase [Nitrospiria bacterium]
MSSILIYKSEDFKPSEINPFQQVEFIIPKSCSTCRLDLYLIKRGIPLSRTRIQNLIQEKKVMVNDKSVKPGHKIRSGDKIELVVPAPRQIMIEPEPIPLDILYQDSDLLVVNKSAGLVMHPAPGNYTGTMVHALLHHVKDLKGIGGEERPGIVHRLDKETSGVVVIAKSEFALTHLMKQFKAHTIEKTYFALVWGKVKHNHGKVELPLGRDKKDRKKISVHTYKPKEAISHYTVFKRFQLAPDKESGISFIEVRPETGRTHQIRVHMASLGHPVVGDKTYGGRTERNAEIKAERQMLHASSIKFVHPTTKVPLTFTAPLHSDMKSLLDQLDNYPRIHLRSSVSNQNENSKLPPK